MMIEHCAVETCRDVDSETLTEDFGLGVNAIDVLVQNVVISNDLDCFVVLNLT